MCFLCRNYNQPSGRLTCIRYCGPRDVPRIPESACHTAMDHGGPALPPAHLGPEYQSCKVPS